MDARAVAESYRSIASLNPPTALPGAWDFGDLPLLRSVNPRQYSYVDALVARKTQPDWSDIRARMEEQRSVRNDLFRWLSELDSIHRNDPTTQFPDAYSLLLWIWTFQLFPQYAGESKSPHKFYYRGEAQDYGPTRFLPKVARPGVADTFRESSVPGRLRQVISEAVLRRHPWETFDIPAELGAYLISTLSCAQSLAVAQHYAYPTPLLDVTTHPEVAMYFATLSKNDECGLLGEFEATSLRRGELSLVLIPPLFARPMRQSAYFVTTRPRRARMRFPFTLYRFRHDPAAPMVEPAWLRTLGPVEPSRPVDLLEDDLDLEPLLQGHLPPSQGMEFPPTPDGSVFGSEGGWNLLLWAFSEMNDATGVRSITAEGVRTNELQPELVYSVTRHAPFHSSLYAGLLSLRMTVTRL